MALNHLSASMILAEHRFRPITGTLVTIGRQSMLFSAGQCDRLLEQMEITKRPGHAYEIDSVTVGVDKSIEPITQESFFAAFCDAKVMALDLNDYEQADMILDLQEDLPSQHHGVADFVVNGGCLDNIFDPNAAIRAMSLLLGESGRIYHMESANSFPTSYLKFSADWFMDYYALNDYADCQTYICDNPNSLGVPQIGGDKSNSLGDSPHEYVVYWFNPYVETEHGAGYDCSSIEAFSRYEIHCIAEKGPSSSSELRPIQKHYRIDAAHRERCLASAKRFRSSARPRYTNGMPFDPTEIPRIDSSQFPEQIMPVAVVPIGFLDQIA